MRLKMLQLEPRALAEATLTVEPNRTKERTESELPKCAKFKTLTAEPKRAVDLKLSEEPSWRTSRTDATGPAKYIFSSTDTPEPSRASALKLRVDPQ
jgi:hypothetical protein